MNYRRDEHCSSVWQKAIAPIFWFSIAEKSVRLRTTDGRPYIEHKRQPEQNRLP